MFDRHLEAEDQEPAQTSAKASAAERVGTASDAEGHPGIGAHLPPGASGELAAPLMAHWVQDGIGTAGTAGEGAGNGAATESQATAGGGGPWAAAPPPGTNDSGPGAWSPGGGSLPSERGGARNLGGGWDFDSAFASQAGMRQTVGARDHVGARALTGAVTAGLPGGASGLSGTMGAAGGLQGTGATDALRAVAAKGGGTATGDTASAASAEESSKAEREQEEAQGAPETEEQKQEQEEVEQEAVEGQEPQASVGAGTSDGSTAAQHESDGAESEGEAAEYVATAEGEKEEGKEQEVPAGTQARAMEQEVPAPAQTRAPGQEDREQGGEAPAREATGGMEVDGEREQADAAGETGGAAYGDTEPTGAESSTVAGSHGAKTDSDASPQGVAADSEAKVGRETESNEEAAGADDGSRASVAVEDSKMEAGGAAERNVTEADGDAEVGGAGSQAADCAVSGEESTNAPAGGMARAAADGVAADSGERGTHADTRAGKGAAEAVHEMQGSFGEDFSGVRLSPNLSPGDANGAKAVALDEHVAYDPAQVDPSDGEGKKIIGHELAHIVQKRRGRVQPDSADTYVDFGPSPASATDSTDHREHLEREADDVGARAARGERATVAPGASAPVYQFWGWDDLKKTASGAWNKVKDTAGGVANTLKDTTGGAWDMVKQGTSGAWSTVKDAAGGTRDQAKQGAGGLWNRLKQGASGAWNAVKDTAGGTQDQAKQGAGDLWNRVKQGAGDLWNRVKQGASGAWSTVKDTAGGTWNQAKQGAGGLWNRLKQGAIGTWGTVKDTAAGAWDEAKQGAGGLWNKVKQGASGAWNTVKGAGAGGWDMAKQGWGKVQQGAEWFTNQPLLNFAMWTLSPMFPLAPMINLGAHLIAGKPGKFLDQFQTVLDVVGVVDPTGIADGANALIHLARGNYAEAALSAISILPYVGDVFGKGGKVLKRLAPFLKKAPGFLKKGWNLAKPFIKKGVDLAAPVVKKGINRVAPWVKKGWEDLKGIGGKGWDRFKNGIKKAPDFFKEKWRALRHGVARGADWAGKKWRQVKDAIKKAPGLIKEKWKGLRDWAGRQKKAIKDLPGKLYDKWRGWRYSIPQKLKGLWDRRAPSWLKKGVDQLKGVPAKLKGLWDRHAPSWLKKGVKAAGDAFNRAKKGINDWAADKWQHYAPEWLQRGAKKASEKWDGFKGRIRQLYHKILNPYPHTKKPGASATKPTHKPPSPQQLAGQAKARTAMSKSHTDPNGVWDQKVLNDPKNKQMKDSLDSFATGDKGKSVKDLDLSKKSGEKLHEDLLDKGFKHKREPLTKEDDGTREYVLSQPGKDGKMTTSDPTDPNIVSQDLYTHPDGGMVRVKPEGDPSSPFRPQPHASKSVLHDPTKGTDLSNEAFKVTNNGEPVPKSPFGPTGMKPKGDVGTAGEYKGYSNEIMDAGHTDLAP